MNKVAILTYHKTTNFGSLLQTYALYRKTSELGYECEILNYINDAVEERERPKKLFECLEIHVLRDYFVYDPFKRRKAKEFSRFLSEKMKLSSVYNKATVKNANSEYDTFLVGSDLVWDDTINDSDRTYMLDFCESNHKRIAYGSSVGSIWDNDSTEVFLLLNRFDAIGVREKEVSDVLNNKLDIKVDFVGDPTLLLSSADWDEMACERCIRDDYVLVYFNDDDLKIYDDALRYGKEHNLPVYVISYSWLPKGLNPIRPTRIEEFLSLIKYANVVFSASYHGMLFSLYFNKQFFYYNRGWKARMRSIAEYLDITDREHYCPEKNREIDYQRVNSLLGKFREESVNCLRRYLGDEKSGI